MFKNLILCTLVTYLIQFFIRLPIRLRHVPIESTQTQTQAQTQTDVWSMLIILYSVRSKIKKNADVDADASADEDGHMEHQLKGNIKKLLKIKQVISLSLALSLSNYVYFFIPQPFNIFLDLWLRPFAKNNLFRFSCFFLAQLSFVFFLLQNKILSEMQHTKYRTFLLTLFYIQFFTVPDRVTGS